jgi:hypothetical protein
MGPTRRDLHDGDVALRAFGHVAGEDELRPDHAANGLQRHQPLRVGLVLYSGSKGLIDGYAGYLLHAAPLVVVMWLVMVTASKPFASDPIGRETRIPMVGILLAFGSWPIFTQAFISAVLGLKATFAATPKERGGTRLRLILPQILAVLVLAFAMIRGLSMKVDPATIGVCAFAGMLILMHSAVFWAFWSEWTQEKVLADPIGGGEE